VLSSVIRGTAMSIRCERDVSGRKGEVRAEKDGLCVFGRLIFKLSRSFWVTEYSLAFFEGLEGSHMGTDRRMGRFWSGIIFSIFYSVFSIFDTSVGGRFRGCLLISGG